MPDRRVEAFALVARDRCALGQPTPLEVGTSCPSGGDGSLKRHFEASVHVAAEPHKVFALLEDQARLAEHGRCGFGAQSVIQYDLPPRGLGRLVPALGDAYARWCVKQWQAMRCTSSAARPTPAAPLCQRHHDDFAPSSQPFPSLTQLAESRQARLARSGLQRNRTSIARMRTIAWCMDQSP